MKVTKVKPFFRWYDLWLGAYIDPKTFDVYVCPFPMVGLKFYKPKEEDIPIEKYNIIFVNEKEKEFLDNASDLEIALYLSGKKVIEQYDRPVEEYPLHKLNKMIEESERENEDRRKESPS